MTVDPSVIKQMSKFMAAVDGSAPAPAVGEPVDQVGDRNVAAMKNILQKFYNASDNVISETSYDRPLREAFITEPTSHGVQIGDWTIVTHEVGKRKFYDVVRIGSNERLLVDMTLYEAAYSVVRHLNAGGHINSASMLEMLCAEQRYAGAVHDMILFRHRLVKHPNGSRTAIYEDRYGAAQRMAASARDRVQKLSECI